MGFVGVVEALDAALGNDAAAVGLPRSARDYIRGDDRKRICPPRATT
jgi:hypothetical protein